MLNPCESASKLISPTVWSCPAQLQTAQFCTWLQIGFDRSHDAESRNPFVRQRWIMLNPCESASKLISPTVWSRPAQLQTASFCTWLQIGFGRSHDAETSVKILA
ncbi:unnamed protein product [Effrenium voratum]|uniref:Uncharacterized protein n=1 Tax=Effrenium voratum TaxID=2562239 RepID=A0AA36I9P0_9DINO|nr:unnamed protein product [Effrenium voratum]